MHLLQIYPINLQLFDRVGENSYLALDLSVVVIQRIDWDFGHRRITSVQFSRLIAAAVLNVT